MGKFVAKFDGRVVADPEMRTLDSGATLLSFPVYVNERRKNRDTGEYEDSGNVSKIRVTLWNDAAENADVQKGDIVEVDASLTEREFEGKNGKGRSLETTFVDAVRLINRPEPRGGGGFSEEDDAGDGWSTPGGKGF